MHAEGSLVCLALRKLAAVDVGIRSSLFGAPIFRLCLLHSKELAR